MASNTDDMIERLYRIKDELKKLKESKKEAQEKFDRISRDPSLWNSSYYDHYEVRIKGNYYVGLDREARVLSSNKEYVENASKEKIDELEAIVKIVFQKDSSYLLPDPILDMIDEYSPHLDFCRQ